MAGLPRELIFLVRFAQRNGAFAAASRALSSSTAASLQPAGGPIGPSVPALEAGPLASNLRETTARPRHLAPARGPGVMPHGDLPSDVEKIRREEEEGKRSLPQARMADVLKAKRVFNAPEGALSCKPTELVINAIKQMVDANVGALVVIDDGKVSGIVTERDYLKKMIVQGRSSQDTEVKEIMTTESVLITVPPEANVYEVMQLMTEKDIRHMPVISGPDKQLIGVVSVRDLLDTVVAEKRKERKELLEYINASY